MTKDASTPPQRLINEHCCAIADQIEPRYRSGKRSYGCGSHVAKLWGNAYEGARLALGGNLPVWLPKAWREG